jgi:cytochrome c
MILERPLPTDARACSFGATLGARSGFALIALVIAGTALFEPGTGQTKPAGGSIDYGRRQIQKHSCGACHEIPGISGARGRVGPPLDGMGHRAFIAGMLRNTPDNMIAWLLDPQKFVPGNAMPPAGLTEQEAADVAAYLGHLK